MKGSISALPHKIPLVQPILRGGEDFSPRIVFFGTPEFAAIILEKMIIAGRKPTAVVTTPDKPVGRKQILALSPVKVLAEKNKIPVLQPKNIRNLELEIRNLQPELVVLAAYGRIIPKEILEIPKFGCLNIHPSLLPKYRGPSPIQATILNGDKETGVTIILMDEKIDHGPILAQREWKFPVSNSPARLRYDEVVAGGQLLNKAKIPITKITYLELSKILAELGAELLIGILPKWLRGTIELRPQDDSQATYTKIIKKEDGHIDWQSSAEEIERQIRAFNVWPGTYTYLKSSAYGGSTEGGQIPNPPPTADPPKVDKQQKPKMLKIIKASVLKIDHQEKLGTVFLAHSTGSVSIPSKVEGLAEKKELAVACGRDTLILEEVQIEGKRKMSAQEFLNGHSEIINTQLI